MSARVAPAAPAWRPGPQLAITFSDPLGRITATDADRGHRLWRTPAGPVPRLLAWTPSGSRLVALTRASLRVLSTEGRLISEVSLGADSRPLALAVHPGGRSAAVVLRDRSGRSEVISFPLDASGNRPRRLFAGQGRFTDLSWSPDGRWLLVAWREADQWLFVRSARVREVDAVSNIARQFDPAGRGRAPFPKVTGWCCRP